MATALLRPSACARARVPAQAGRTDPGALLVALVLVVASQLFDVHEASLAAPMLAIALSLGIFVRAGRDEDGNAVVVAWALRLVVAFVVYRALITSGAFPGDWTRYDREGWNMAALIRSGRPAHAFTLGGGADNVSLLVGYVYAVTGQSISSVVILESACGFLASWIYLGACRLLVRRPPALVRYGILFFPSFVFWTNIMGKYSLIALGLALGVYGAIAMCVGRGRAFANVAMMVAGVCLCLLIRPYLCLIQVPALLIGVTLAILRRPSSVGGTSLSRRALAVAALVLGIALLPLVMQTAMKKLKVQSLDMDEFVDAAGFQRKSRVLLGGSNTGFSGYSAPADVLRKLPQSLGTLLLRPFPWEARNAAAAVAAVDTLLFLGLWVWVAVNRIRTRSGRDARLALARPAARFLLVWTVLWTMMFMNMTANLGTMVRHRVQIVPVVLLLAAVFASRAGKRPEGGEA